jgi:hypothetical protein
MSKYFKKEWIENHFRDSMIQIVKMIAFPPQGNTIELSI